MKDFSNINVGDKVTIHHQGFQSECATVVKKFKKHFRVLEKICYYDFFYNGNPKTKTFIPMTITV